MSLNMKYWGSFGFLFIVLNYNVTIVGKIWLTLMILLRLMVILFGVYPLYQDELATFICNTLQPDCSQICYDGFTAVSQARFWLIELMFMLVPFAVFAIYILHSVVKQVVGIYSLPCSYCKEINVSAGFIITKTASNDSKTRITCGAHEMAIPDFSRAYAIQLLLRIMIEIGFAISSYYFFGFFVQKLYKCNMMPCPHPVNCFVPRSTEKSAMIILFWIVSGFSLLLGLVDLFVVVRSCRNKLGGFSMEKKCKTSMYQGEEPNRDLSNLGNLDVPKDCGNIPMEGYTTEWQSAKDHTL